MDGHYSDLASPLSKADLMRIETPPLARILPTRRFAL